MTIHFGLRRRTAVIVAIAVGLLLVHGRAQEGRKPLREGLLKPPPASAFEGTTHTSWTRRDGAPGSITSLAQTKDGYLWIGSSLGLYRFDGLRFAAYPFGPAMQPLPSMDVSSLAADAEGGLWVAFRSTAIVHLLADGSTKFYGRESGLSSSTLDHVAALPDGSVWAVGGSRMFRLQGERWSDVNEAYSLGGGGVFSVLFDREGNIWVGRDKRLMVLRKSAARFVDVPNDVHYVSSMAQSANGQIWIADAWRSVQKLSDSPKELFHLKGKAELLVDRDDTLWIAQDDEGLARVRHVSAADGGMPSEVAGPGDLSARETHALLEDREGNIWVGTDRGLDRFKKTPFVPFRETELRFFPSLIAADDGAVWINSHGSSLMRVADGKTTAVGAHVNTGPLARRRNGDICFVDQTSYQLQCYGASARLEPLPDGMQHVPPKSLVEDADGSLLLSTQGKGVWRYADGQWKPAGAALGGPWSLFSDSSGRLWLGYGDNRVVVRQGGNYTTLRVKDELWSNTLVFAENGGTVWAGGSNGLCYFDGQTLQRVHALDRNLLLGISGIAFDRSGSMWLNGAAGVLRVAPDELLHLRNDPRHLLRAEVFDENDGLVGQPTQYKRAPSAIVDGNGTLWFATSGNVVSLNPKLLGVRETLPNVLIENVLVDGKPVPGAGSSANAVVRVAANRLHGLEISYIGIDLSAPERVNYRYRLLGEDNAWQDAGGRRQAFYTRLNPGTYQFEISASNGGDWSELAAPLRIEVTPAFYQAWWFRVLCALASGLCVWLLLRARTRFLTEQVQSRMSERLAERERVARELHDGLLQGFQGLMMRFHLATQTIPHEMMARTEMEQALDRADDLLIESRDRIRDLRYETLLPDTLREAFENLQEELSVETTRFSLSEEGAPRELQPGSYREIYAIGREAILNARCHSGAGRIEVSIQFEAMRFTLCVSDNGRGIPQEILSSKGKSDHWGLAGMYERALNLKGELKIDSADGEGTRVHVTVPARTAYRARGESLWTRGKAGDRKR